VQEKPIASTQPLEGIFTGQEKNQLVVNEISKPNLSLPRKSSTTTRSIYFYSNNKIDYPTS
jgi:hypothetical protein